MKSQIPKTKGRFKRVAISFPGTATVEFAVVLPVFILLLLGTIETCTMIFLQQSLEIAAYEATRIAIVPKTKMSDIQTACADILSTRRVKDVTVTVSPVDFQSGLYGSFIRVDVPAPCTSNAVFPLAFYGSRALTGTVEMMKEF